MERRDGGERVPWPQALLDSELAVLALGVLVPFTLYILWGLWDLLRVPVR